MNLHLYWQTIIIKRYYDCFTNTGNRREFIKDMMFRRQRWFRVPIWLLFCYIYLRPQFEEHLNDFIDANQVDKTLNGSCNINFHPSIARHFRRFQLRQTSKSCRSRKEILSATSNKVGQTNNRKEEVGKWNFTRTCTTIKPWESFSTITLKFWRNVSIFQQMILEGKIWKNRRWNTKEWQELWDVLCPFTLPLRCNFIPPLPFYDPNSRLEIH